MLLLVPKRSKLKENDGGAPKALNKQKKGIEEENNGASLRIANSRFRPLFINRPSIVLASVPIQQ